MQTPAGSSGCGCVCLRRVMADFLAAFASRKRSLRFFFLAGLGVIAALGQAPFDLWPATILALAALFLLTPANRSAAQAAFHLWGFGIGYFAFSLRWIVEPFLVDIARHGWMAPFALVLMAAGAGLFWALAAALSHRIAPRSPAMLGLALVGAEIVRSLILTGFPWALLGHVWVQTGLAQVAAFGGPHLLTLLTVICGWALALFAGRDRLVGLIVLGLVVAVSFVMRPGPAPLVAPDLPIVRLVQPNAPQQQKWDPSYREVFLNRMIRLTSEGAVPDLVVWPETAVPFLLNQIEGDLSLLSGAARGVPLVFGIQRRDEELRAFNSLVVMGPGGQVQSIYDKRHLVPFGEYMPGARLLGQMGATGLARNLGIGFTPGTGPGPITLPGIGRAIALICYEGIFAEEITDGGERARLMLLITNDAWFGQGPGPRQHLAQARLRAIEQGLPMVRVANTGISAMIDAKGRIVAFLPLGTQGAIDVALPSALPETLYARWGDWPILPLLILLMTGVYTLRQHDSD